MKTIIFRPSVDRVGDFADDQLREAFEKMSLVDKTVCEDRIVYIFGEKEQLSSPL